MVARCVRQIQAPAGSCAGAATRRGIRNCADAATAGAGRGDVLPPMAVAAGNAAARGAAGAVESRTRAGGARADSRRTTCTEQTLCRATGQQPFSGCLVRFGRQYCPSAPRACRADRTTGAGVGQFHAQPRRQHPRTARVAAHRRFARQTPRFGGAARGTDRPPPSGCQRENRVLSEHYHQGAGRLVQCGNRQPAAFVVVSRRTAAEREPADFYFRHVAGEPVAQGSRV